jgi:cytochrome c5
MKRMTAHKGWSGLPAVGLGVLMTAVLMSSIGCRGTITRSTPVHINPNMDRQERFDPQAANPMFADGRAMRPPVPGTVARGFLKDDTEFYEGRDANGAPVTLMPVALTRELAMRGRDRYNIFCAPCHGKAGDGQGIIITGNYGYVPAPSYHDDRLRGVSDGHLYDVIANGFNNMPGYAQQIPVADRWAIVAYVRALQRSQNATEGDIPASVLAEIRARSGGNIRVN